VLLLATRVVRSSLKTQPSKDPPTTNLGKGGKEILSWHHFKSIEEKICHAFFHNDYPNNPWYPIKPLICGFNANHMHTVTAAIKRVLDELTSTFQPRTTKS
jgi:hypothetical protein